MKLTGEQVKKAINKTCYSAYFIADTFCGELADELNKLLKNEAKIDKLTYVDQSVYLSQMESIRELLTIIVNSISKLGKIQEQLTSLSGENISKQFTLFLEKQEKRDSDILREIAILDEKVKNRWGDNYRVEFDIDPECGLGSVKFLVNDSMEAIDDFHKKDNYESARNTSIHALVTIDWDKFEPPPQKEEPEIKPMDVGGSTPMPYPDKIWTSMDEILKQTPPQKEETQEKSCLNCANMYLDDIKGKTIGEFINYSFSDEGIKKVCSCVTCYDKLINWQPKDNQEGR